MQNVYWIVHNLIKSFLLSLLVEISKNLQACRTEDGFHASSNEVIYSLLSVFILINLQPRTDKTALRKIRQCSFFSFSNTFEHCIVCFDDDSKVNQLTIVMPLVQSFSAIIYMSSFFWPTALETFNKFGRVKKFHSTSITAAVKHKRANKTSIRHRKVCRFQRCPKGLMR